MDCEPELEPIEAGRIVDSVILDKSPWDPAVQDEQLSDIRVLMTLVGGTIKFTEVKFAKSQGLPQVGY